MFMRNNCNQDGRLTVKEHLLLREAICPWQWSMLNDFSQRGKEAC